MSGVVELHIKALDEFRWERFDRRVARLCVGVADGAHCLVFAAGKLVEMTANTRLVAAEFTRQGAALAVVASVAGKLLVLGDLVRKSLECLCRRSLRHRIGR